MMEPNYLEIYEHSDGSGLFGWSVDTAGSSCWCGTEPSFDEALAAAQAAIVKMKGETT
jgi:hypothetical protein